MGGPGGPLELGPPLGVLDLLDGGVSIGREVGNFVGQDENEWWLPDDGVLQSDG